MPGRDSPPRSRSIAESSLSLIPVTLGAVFEEDTRVYRLGSRRIVGIWSAESSSAQRMGPRSHHLCGSKERSEHLTHFGQLIMGLKAARVG
jgi:hypothetical protein